MEIRVLQYFLTVAREESISRAAEVLHVTQPTLSRQLAQLEEELGVVLFHRGKRKITLTSEGILLRRRAEEILDLMDKTERGLMDAGQLLEPIDMEKFEFIRLKQKEQWVVSMRPDSPLSPNLTSTSVLAWKRQQPFAPAAERFIQFIRESLREEQGKSLEE